MTVHLWLRGQRSQELASRRRVASLPAFGFLAASVSSWVCVCVSPPVVGGSLLPAGQLRLLQVGEQQGPARRAPPAVEARRVLLHPLRAAGSRVHSRGTEEAFTGRAASTTREAE